MIERADNETPKEITDWLLSPYHYFSNLLGSKEAVCLDVACGNNIQLDILKSKFSKVISIDKESNNETVISGDILALDIPDKSVDIVFCFETIEHLKPTDLKQILSELVRVTKCHVVIGSVNRLGPDKLNDVIIFKNGNNPFHVYELDHENFEKTFVDHDILNGTYMSNTYDGEFKFEYGMSNQGISNYIIINL